MKSSWIMVGLAGASVALAQNPEQLIATHRQSASIAHKNPYILQFKAGNGALLLYGSQHTDNVKDPQISDIERRWAAFHPTVAYNEGRDAETLDDPAKALECYEEPGFVRYLAGRDQVPVATFEPSWDAEIAYALTLNDYSTVTGAALLDNAAQLKVYYALFRVAGWQKSDDEAALDKKITDTLSQLARHGLKAYPNTLNEFAAAYRSLFPSLPDWRDAPKEWFDPTQKGEYTNDLTDAISLFRDKHIFHVLVERAKRGDRVFAVVGSSHVIAQEAALTQVLGKPELKVNGLE